MNNYDCKKDLSYRIFRNNLTFANKYAEKLDQKCDLKITQPFLVNDDIVKYLQNISIFLSLSLFFEFKIEINLIKVTALKVFLRL